ncbi:MAG: hypothetical protein ACI8RD_008091 [Bacillariaceae sp.]|jgi:hypothetical protein
MVKYEIYIQHYTIINYIHILYTIELVTFGIKDRSSTYHTGRLSQFYCHNNNVIYIILFG